jgi:hypothetical protein
MRDPKAILGRIMALFLEFLCSVRKPRREVYFNTRPSPLLYSETEIFVKTS